MFEAVKEFHVGRPQVAAGLMLLAFLAQAFWVAYSRKLSSLEFQYVESGLPLKPGQEYRVTSPLTAVLAAAPFRVVRILAGQDMSKAAIVPQPWMARVPFLIFGLWLGAALWWVARRLFENHGGFVALALYCTSPAMAMIAANVGPEVLLAWSSFGLMYTAIGVAHTLYAPWRKWLPRTVLLGLSIGFALATALWCFTLVLLAFAFMLYLAPGRRKTALLVMAAATLIGLGVCGFFILLAHGYGAAAPALLRPQLSVKLLQTLNFVFADGYLAANSYLFALFFIIALTIYGSWDRARYFGNSAPLLMSFVTVFLFSLVPGIYLWDATLGLSYVFVFIGGTYADLLETNYGRGIARIMIAGFLLRAVLGVLALSRWIRIPA